MRRSLSPFFIVLSFVTLLLLCYSSAFAQSQLRIINGNRVYSLNTGVVRVIERDPSGRSDMCSGELITRRHVLTAWHCVSRTASRMTVMVGNRAHAVQRVAIHPDVAVDAMNGIVYNDVAVLRLRTRASGRVLPLLQSKEIEVGDEVSIFGYGLDELQNVGYLRRGKTAVEFVNDSHVVTRYRGFDSDTCSGDSGGPAIHQYIDSEGVKRRGIVGITSTGTLADCSIGDQSYFINLQDPTVFNFIVEHAPRVTVQ